MPLHTADVFASEAIDTVHRSLGSIEKWRGGVRLADVGDDQNPGEPGEEPAVSSGSQSDVGFTAEFEILEAGLDRDIAQTESANPRETLSDDALAEHVEALSRVARARERASWPDE